MTDRVGVGELLARVEAATGADRAIDHDLEYFVAMPDQPAFHRKLAHRDNWPTPTYSASLDAALALVERVLPGVFWNLGTCSRTPRTYSADFACPGGDETEGKTPALALLAALLKALRAEAASPAGVSDEVPGNPS